MGVYLPNRTAAQEQQQRPAVNLGQRRKPACCCNPLTSNMQPVAGLCCSAAWQRLGTTAFWSTPVDAATAPGNRTIEGRALEGAIWLLHHHDVDGTSHVGGEAIHSTQDGRTPHDHPTLRRGRNRKGWVHVSPRRAGAGCKSTRSLSESCWWLGTQAHHHHGTGRGGALPHLDGLCCLAHVCLCDGANSVTGSKVYCITLLERTEASITAHWARQQKGDHQQSAFLCCDAVPGYPPVATSQQGQMH
jgi:hypothetical protein